jgi:hypothetical protein
MDRLDTSFATSAAPAALAPLSADDLLAGAAATYTVNVPANVLQAAGAAGQGNAASPGGQVTLRPLTVRDVQRVAQAAKDQRLVSGVLMVQQALVSPKLTVEQAGSLSAGLLQFLLDQVNRISGLTVQDEDLDSALKAPLTRACFVLAREFGWTPAECAELTLGQILLYLEMLARQQPADGGGG